MKEILRYGALQSYTTGQLDGDSVGSPLLQTSARTECLRHSRQQHSSIPMEADTWES